MVDPTDLCVESDKLVWILYCDLICLNYDGNVLDASVIALSAALQNVKLPTVTIDKESDCPSTDFETLSALKINCFPSAITFTVFDGTTIIVDPTAKEEEVTSGTCTVVTNENDSIIYLERTGGVALSEVKIQSCINKAIKHGSLIRKLFDAVRT